MNFYRSVLRPLLFCLDAERAHHLAIQGLKLGLIPFPAPRFDPVLRTNLMGLDFPTPIGLAAGFDKNAEVFEALLKLGFGFVETGTVTPQAQPGNDKPRMFRLIEDNGVINRLGFNNLGLDRYKAKIRRWSETGNIGIVGANVGKNKTSSDSIADYVMGISALSDYASYLVVNVSSPNTPGLRDLQAKDDLKELLAAVMVARNTSSKRPPLLLKIAPDLSPEDKQDIANVALDAAIDGIIVTNTTVERPSTLRSRHNSEAGGLSGGPLFQISTDVLRDMYSLTDGRIPLIGVGGVSNGEQAYLKIKAGASLVQIYSAMIYRGPQIGALIANELAALVKNDGYQNVSEAIGSDHR
ncbi:MAG: quinone-dependent dihydroorotate dehydrogenase [Rhodospirillaceae bacterium]|nr:quinone-dependent dihydroorotate dehydrogenase [Rhodospirillaceae bacterium]MBT5938288.1 quinone-dependent dihydroorotate dehydrogenase [Rhodospirillaceae bacterium]MBT7267922.1 quinone-dependent dihydroorotate dehydrogenase [Rhodospirillaceae bacterium]